MYRINSAVLATVVLIFAASMIASAAGVGTGDWPMPRHDAKNTGCNPTTGVALPSIEWIKDVSVGIPDGKSCVYQTYVGPVMDANRIYITDRGEGSNGWLFSYDKAGNRSWLTSGTPHAARTSGGSFIELSATWWFSEGGVSLWNDGIENYIVGGAGCTNPGNFWWIKASDGISPAGYSYPMGNSNRDIVSQEAPTIGPDGTIYSFMGNEDSTEGGYFKAGTIYAWDSQTHTPKWSWGEGGTVPGGKSLGFHFGPMAVTQLNGKNILIVSMAQDKDNDVAGTTNPDYAGPYAGKNLFAIQDNGSSCEVIWSAQTAYTDWSPVISPDGRTVYVACTQFWYGDPAFKKTLYAYDVATGALNWSVDTGSEHWSMPAVGSNGTIYLSGTCLGGNGTLFDPAGKLVAVGADGMIKWTMYTDAESDSYFQSPVVNSSNPPVVYVTSTSGRMYAVQDLGSSYKLLWMLTQPGAGHPQVWPVPMIANDGAIYAYWSKYLLKLRTGYSGGQLGISGYVKKPNGEPLQNAYVVASKSNNPMMGLVDKYYLKTDASGFYSITVPVGTWYVQAWANGRLASSMQTAVVASDGAYVSLTDFTLPVAGPNLAFHKPGETNSHGNQSLYTVPIDESQAFDGNLGTRFISNESQANPVSTTNPTWLRVDLGANMSVGEAVIKWESASAVEYKLQCLPDGVDPEIEANWTPDTVVASTTTGTGGVPDGWDSLWNITRRAEVAKFAPRSARYWRICSTKTRYAKFLSLYEFELRDGAAAGPESGQCADIRSMDPGANVVLEDKQITAAEGGGIASGFAFIEDENRAGGIKIQASGLASLGIGLGDRVNISGKVAPGGDYVEANVIKTGNPRPLDAVSMNSTSAGKSSSEGLFVKLTGKVGERGNDSEGNYFKINDGGTDIYVKCGSISQPASGSNVKVRGVLDGFNGTTRILRARYEMDIAPTADDQPLPLAGTRHFFRDCLIIGPFTESTINDADNNTRYTRMLTNDFLGGETSAKPVIGDTVTYTDKGTGAATTRTWQRYDGANDIIDFNKFFNNGTQNNWAAAYVVVYLWSPEAYDSASTFPVDLTLGSDDSIYAFINGQKITTEFVGGRGAGYVQNWDKSNVGATLNAGPNVLLFKIINGAVDFGWTSNFIYAGSINGDTGGWGAGIVVEGLGYYPNKPANLP